jgi:nucleoside-diphosphate-sugar epimerase
MNNTYAISKTTIERFALMFNKEHGTKIAVVRGLNAYGERQKHKPVRKITPNFVCQSLRGEAIKIFGSGESIMDMVYVKDLAYYLVESVVADESVMDYQTVYSAGPGVETSVNQIADIINEATGNKTPVKHIEMRAGETDKSVVLGHPNTLTFAKDYVMKDIKEGMAQTVAWYKENYNWQND